jgi:hypothetical protein
MPFDCEFKVFWNGRREIDWREVANPSSTQANHWTKHSLSVVFPEIYFYLDARYGHRYDCVGRIVDSRAGFSTLSANEWFIVFDLRP